MLARKTRCKKKAEFETLRKQLLKLRTENDRLKELVKGTLPTPISSEALLGCDVQLPEDVAKVQCLIFVWDMGCGLRLIVLVIGSIMFLVITLIQISE